MNYNNDTYVNYKNIFRYTVNKKILILFMQRGILSSNF